MHEWLDVDDGMGVRTETESGFRTHMKEFCNDLTIAGMSVLTDYAIPLRDACGNRGAHGFRLDT